MDHTDNELQGTNSSGSLGGLDVRRRIPIKLISKQGNKAKPAPRTPRTINRMPAKAPPGDEGNLVKLTGPEGFLYLIPPDNPCDFTCLSLPFKNVTYSFHFSELLMSHCGMLYFFVPL
uniref:Cbl proto-oncogene like 1 n=1 Tax=Molossus molossus TaxID=27622 RepID=A0A7J8H9Y3_MOLMO|nr:Cbl proto-oncogene like 1 [Molossus molossus]